MRPLWLVTECMEVAYVHTGLSSLQHHMDSTIGVHIIDRWTYYALEFLERVSPGSKATLADFVSKSDMVHKRSSLKPTSHEVFLL